MSFTSCVIVQFKAGELSGPFMKLLKDPKEGAQKSLAWSGCQGIEWFTDKEDKDKLIILHKWENEQAFDEYHAMRKETGFFQKVGPLLAAPPRICKLNQIKL